LQSKFNRDAVRAAATNQISKWPGSCSEISFDSKFDVVVLQPAQFSADARSLTAGAWIESFTVTACGVTRRHNIFNVVKGSPVLRLPKLVGTSRADHQLQTDAAPHLFAGAARFVPQGCKSFYASDTQFLGEEGAVISNAKPGPACAWREEWTLWACGKEIVVPIKFIPDATGTGIIADGSKVRVK